MFNRQTGDFASAKPSPLMFYWLLGGLWALLMVASPLPAAEVSARIEAVQVGFRGLVEVGRWTPISIRVTGTPGTEITPRVTSADAEGRPVRQIGTPLVLGETPSVISMVYQHGPIDSPVVVELVRGSETLAERTLRVGTEGNELQTVTQLTDFVICLGEPLLGFEEAARAVQEIRKLRPDRVAPLVVQNYSSEQMAELPPDSLGWEAVDVCVITADCIIPDTLGSELRSWVRRGGRLVFVGGAEMASLNSPGLASWVPVKWDGDLILHDITALNREIPGSATLKLREGSLPAVRLTVESGAVSARSLEGPIVVRAGISQGSVTAIVLDINDLPFVRTVNDRQSLVWESLPDLCRWLSGLPVIPKLEIGTQRPQSDLNPTGVSDLQTQLVNSMDWFPEVVRPSYWVVLSSALLFLVLVGPLDYLLVHRLLKRPHWTWLTLPAWIGLGTFVGLSAASRTGGTEVLTRQLDLVTWDAVAGSAQLDSWMTIYSPEHHRYQVACVPNLTSSASSADTRIRWAGRPEPGFRGLYRSSSIQGGAVTEQTAGCESVSALPIRYGSSAVLEAKSEWEQAPPLTVDLTGLANGHLKGTFSHQFEGELVDWVLAYGNFAYLPVRSDAGVEAPLQAGQSIRVDQVPSRLLTDYLVRLSTRSVLRSDQKTKDYSLGREIYDPLSRDLFNMLRTASFFQVMGGKSYTGITNSTLQNEDLTRLVEANRAVVFGRWRNSAYEDSEMAVEGANAATEPLAARFTIDGKAVSPRYRECFVRWILPVKQAAVESTAP